MLLMRIFSLFCALATSGCLVVFDFEYGGAPADGGGAPSAGSAAGGGSPEGGSEVGGAGGSGGSPCDDVDLTTETDCGTCGFECGSAECVFGACGFTSIDLKNLGGKLTGLTVVDEVVYVTQISTDAESPFPAGNMRTLPTDFVSDSDPKNGELLPNVIGAPLVHGTFGKKRVYQSGQDQNPPRVTACDEVDCETVPLGGAFATHPNAIVAVDKTLYVLAAGADNRLRSFEIAPSGVPSDVPTSLVDSYTDLSPEGVFDMHEAVGPPRMFWSGFHAGGCLYKADIGSFDSRVSCWSPSFYASSFRITSDGSTIYAQDELGISRLSGEPPVVTAFAAGVGLYALDDAHVYVTLDTYLEKIRVLSPKGKIEGGPPAASSKVELVDASHARYLFYIAGTTLYRWPRPHCDGSCGDGCVEGPEECDDGNTLSGDDCSDACVLE